MCLIRAMSVRAFPAGVRDVDDDAVGSGPFHLEIGMAAGRHRRVDVVLRGQALAIRRFELLAGRVEVVDLEAEMVDAREVRTMRPHVGRLLPLGVQDRDVDMAVGEEYRAIGAAPQLLEAERRFVELGDLRRLLRRQRDMLDACHGQYLPCGCLTDFTTETRRTRRKKATPQREPTTELSVISVSPWLILKSHSILPNGAPDAFGGRRHLDVG